MATPINVSISESVSIADSAKQEKAPFNPKPADALSFQEAVTIEMSPWNSRYISDSVPIADSLYAEMPQFVQENLVMQEMVSCQPYEPSSVTYYIGSESPVGVMPQVGSAIYTKWEHKILKEVQVARFMHSAVPDPEESGRERLIGLRHFWSLEVNVNATLADTIFAFILSHYGAGIPFYFYDLQNNNFVYDATGVNTSGRYTVRLVPESFTKNQQVGSRQYGRFVINYDVIEVGA